jgi:hypothetical protein
MAFDFNTATEQRDFDVIPDRPSPSSSSISGQVMLAKMGY